MSRFFRYLPARYLCALAFASACGLVQAEPNTEPDAGANAGATAEANALTGIQAIREGAQQQLKLTFRRTPATEPSSFSTPNPPRLVLDFANTLNATGHARQLLDAGELRHVDIVQVSGRTRLVIALKRAIPFVTRVQDKTLILSFSDKATSANASAASDIAADRNAILDIDFRRGSNEAGRIIIDLSQPQAAIDIRRQGQALIVDVMKTRLPDVLRRRLDVRDFGTPVQSISTSVQGDVVRLLIEPSGQWEHTAWQTDKRLVVEVRPWRAEDGKVSSGARGMNGANGVNGVNGPNGSNGPNGANGAQGYRGDKLSLNFQNIDVRALLQVIADFTGLNVVASDTVTGQLTLRLRDVPWDQALDIVMQARGLDMRRHGNVLWIAPKDELLTKERLELEQKAQISELEPLVTETFQLNYQKADAFRQVFGLDGQSRGSILSRRGSASAEPRTNKLFVTDTPSRLEEVRKLIQLTDVPTRQVMIEARIVEADDSFNRNLGAKLGFVDLRSVNQQGSTGINLPGSTRLAVTGNYLGVGEQTLQAKATDKNFIPNTQFVDLPANGIGTATAANIAVSLYSSGASRFLNLELSALESEGKGKIISSPRVVTADQQPAVIEQGEEIPYQQATSSGATSIQFKKANLKLEVTPQITPDGQIILMVDVAKDSRGTPVGNSFAINTKHVKANVQVENGGTAVLGGIFTQDEQESRYKVPFFGDIPLLGHLFRKTSRSRVRSELLIFITPRVITDPTAMQ